MLALHLLDILVKNCGYPFHLQISTKDFLNELVRRFPERPPVYPPPPMAKVLELIHEWKNTLCVHSKHKEDLVHIRDMHRLLSYKGYRFPDYDKRATSVLNPTDTLQTPDELEEEDRAAQAAKLQELIRRGTPKDLAAAQELMKVMSGAEPEKRPDYEGKVQTELDRIQQRILLLNEMLNNAKPKERFVDGDAFDQIARKSRNVQPKIQKWIEESAENDPDAMDRLLLMNDLINNILRRYESFKAGDHTATADVDNSFLSPDEKVKVAAQSVSLIDFDDFAEPEPASTTLDDFNGLSLGSSTSNSNSQPLSLFDLEPSGFSSPSATMAPSRMTSNSQVSGSYFSNPPAPQTQSSARPNYASSSIPAAAIASPIQWGSPASSAPGRASTPGAIQLGDSFAAPPPSAAENGSTSMNGSAANGGAKGKAKDPFGDLEGLF